MRTPVMFLAGNGTVMTDQIIPNTTDKAVAYIAAALALVLASDASNTYNTGNKPPLDQLLDAYKKAYAVVRDADLEG